MERIDIGRLPVSSDNPQGQDVKYEPDFEALSEEINKLSSPTAVTGIDWAKVVSLGEKILRDQSKNLTVSCYLSIGLLHAEGLHGLADGLKILRDLLDVYWDLMFPPPKRKKARINTLDWWNGQLKKLLENYSSEIWASGERDAVLEDVKAIDAVIADKLEEGPNLRALQEKLADLLPSADAVKEEPDQSGPVAEAEKPFESAASPVSKISSPSTPSHPSVPEPVTDAPAGGTDALVYFKTGMNYLSTSANMLFSRDQSDFLAYRLNRIIAWFEVDSLPPTVDGKTMLEPPDKQLQSLLAGLYESSSWPELLQAAESRVREYLFWLDLDFWVFSALDNLQFNIAAQAVADDTRLFVTRLKGLGDCSFSDGTPFAGDETRTWLDSAGSQEGEVDIVGAIPQASVDQDVEKDIQKAIQFADEKGNGAMLSYMQEKIACTASVRSRFNLYLVLCQLLMQHKQASLLQPFVDEIIALIDRYHLEQWEPELALQAMSVAYQCLNKASKKRNEEKLRNLFTRITLLSAQKSLEIM